MEDFIKPIGNLADAMTWIDINKWTDCVNESEEQ